MTANWQTWTALLIVAVVTFLLVRGVIRKRRNPGCGGDCGCPSTDLKKHLKSLPRP